MTVYEALKDMPERYRRALERSGLNPSQFGRYARMRELYVERAAEGVPKMDIYAEIADKFFTSERRVMEILKRLNREL